MSTHRTHRLAFAAALALLAGGCRKPSAGAAVPGVDVDAIRRQVERCPIVLTDDALDDLATYQACTLPHEIVRVVRNDYIDDELRMPDLRRLDEWALDVSRTAFEAQLDRFVDPPGVLRGYMWIDSNREELHPDPVLAPGVTIPFLSGTGPPQACSGRCEGRLVTPPHPDRPYRPARWAELRNGITPERPLRGVRVGLDPGHAGGRFGPLEGRHVRVAQDGVVHWIQEGDLTLRTALELRERLVALGASVSLTRNDASLVHPGPLHGLRPAAERLLRRIVLDPEYVRIERGLSSDDRLRLRSATALHAVVRESRFEGLRTRAFLLAAESPDLVLSIHFNATPPGIERGKPQDLITMVRGFHARERLYNPHHRLRAIADAFAVDDFDASVHLGALCVRAMSRELGIPIAADNHYQDHLPVRNASGMPIGVDAWDGALLRYLDGVAVLTEGPWVDHSEEARRLAATLDTPLGTPGTRTDQYAKALASCIVDWVGRWTRSERHAFASDP